MVRRLFWEDMYLREFDAKVTYVKDDRLMLDQTAFNPRGGGLVSDTGFIGGVRVLEVFKEGDDIIHLMSEPVRFSVGEEIHCVLDWERRYKIMRMHTAAHLLSAVIYRRTGALITGNSIQPDESRIDFSLESYDKEKILSYVDEVNKIIERGIDVTVSFIKRDEALQILGLVKLAKAVPPAVDVLRIVKIGDVDMQADGGVHVKNTREIGKILVTKVENKGKINRRIYYSLASI